MLVYIQWTRAVPQDWEAYEITSLNDWRKLPFRDEPSSGMTGTMDVDLGPGIGVQTVIDPTHPTADDPGWIHDLSFAGISCSGADHHYAGRDGARIRYMRWNDDVEWAGDRYAQEWSFALPVIDTELGILQPDIQLTVWAEDAVRRSRYEGTSIGRPPVRYPVQVFDWSAWSQPGPANMRRHSIWMTDASVAAHEAAKTFLPDFPGWTRLTGG